MYFFNPSNPFPFTYPIIYLSVHLSAAGALQRAYRAAQVRGAPLPILWVAEYFTLDGEGFRFGRHYRLAGWYAHICVW